MKTNCSSLEILESRIAPAAIIVTNLHDSGAGSLHQAILDANASAGPDVITFQTTVHGHTVPLKGTIKLLTDLPAITDDLTITGPTVGKASGLIINGNTHQIFDITGADVTMTDLTVTHGQAEYGGGFFIGDSGHTVALTDVTITANHAFDSTPPGNGNGLVAYGGGVDIAAGSTVTISKSKISGNFCTGHNGGYLESGGGAYGGGIRCSGNLTITDSVISGNVAQGGKAGGSDLSGERGGDTYGGGIYCSTSTGNLTIENSTISGNKALGGSGGSGEDGQFGGRGGRGYGGGVCNFTGTTSITDCVISKNTAHGGKGGAGAPGTHGNTAGDGGDGGQSLGGGVCNKSSNGNAPIIAATTIKTSTISGNTAIGGTGGAGGTGSKHGAPGPHGVVRGGGVYSGDSFNNSNETLDITDSTISTNSSGGDGGGVFIKTGTATIGQSTIAKNKASGDGGGFTLAGGTTTIHNSTVASNQANAKSGFGGGFDIFNVTSVELISTIIAGNTAKTSPDMDSAGSTVNTSYTLIQHVTANTDFNDLGHNVTGMNPLLGPLASNGGPTQTMLPSVRQNSPVINAGSNPDNLTTDQRGAGFARVLPVVGGTIDIGAVEAA